MIENTLIGRSIKWTFFGTASFTFWQFIQNVILARILIPEDFGKMMLIYVVIHIFIVLQEFGFNEAIVQKKDLINAELGNIFWINLSLAAIMLLLLLICAPWIAAFLNQAGLSVYFMITGVVLIANAICLTSNALLKRNLEFKKINIVEVISYVTGSVTAIVLALLNAGFVSLLTGFIMYHLIRSVLFLNLGKKLITFKFDLSRIDHRKYFSFNSYLTGEKIMNNLSSTVDNMIIGKYFGNTILGYYSHAWNIMMIPFTKINNMFSQVAFPYYSKIREDQSTMKLYFFNTFLFILLLNLPAYFLFNLCGKELILIIYGEKWAQAVVLLQLLAWVGMIKSINNPGGSLLLALGKTKTLFYWNTFWLGLLISIFLYYSIVDKNIEKLIYGLLWASILSIPVWFRIIYLRSGINILQIIYNLMAIILCAVTAYIISLFVQNDAYSLVFNLIVKGSTFIGVFGILLISIQYNKLKELFQFFVHGKDNWM